MDFQDQVVIVTGGGTGIGRAISLLVAEGGAKVAVIYSKSEQEALETVEAIQAKGGKAIAIKADVTDESAVQTMVEKVASNFGRIDYLVNNAGITKQLPFKDLEAATSEVWDSLFAVNVKGTFFCSRAVVPHMKKVGHGAIVNIGSIAGITGLGSSLPYAVSKSAVHGLTKSLARALAPEIQVNCVAPGAVDTRWWIGNEDKMHELAGNTPLGRIATPEDIAEMVRTVLKSKSITAEVILIDGGQAL